MDASGEQTGQRRSGIDFRPVGRFQTMLFILCLITLVIDGLDLQLLSFAAPSIIAEWDVSRATFGPAMAATLVGMAAGNGIGGWLADRFGRRHILVISVAIFGFGTLATAAVQDMSMLVILRTICGIGFGAAVPSIMSLTVEWLPKRLHGPAVGLLAVSTPLGGALGAAVAGGVIDEWGWRACFIASGAVTLLLAVALYRYIPESPVYLVRTSRLNEARHLLARAFGPLTDDEVAAITSSQPKAGQVNASVLGRENLRVNTGFSLSFFANSFAGYGFISWTPVILSGIGMDIAEAIRGSFFFNLFAIIGAFGGASIMHWIGSRMTMIGSILLSIGAVAGLIVMLPGYRDMPALHAAIMTMLGLAGLGVGGLQGCNYALSAISYPSTCRSSGIGLVTAAGRVGGIVAVLIGGLLLSLDSNIVQAFFGAMGFALILASAGVLIVDRHIRGAGE